MSDCWVMGVRWLGAVGRRHDGSHEADDELAQMRREVGGQFLHLSSIEGGMKSSERG